MTLDSLRQYLDLAEWDDVASKWITARPAHFAGVLYSLLILDKYPNSVLIFHMCDPSSLLIGLTEDWHY